MEIEEAKLKRQIDVYEEKYYIGVTTLTNLIAYNSFLDTTILIE